MPAAVPAPGSQRRGSRRCRPRPPTVARRDRRCVCGDQRRWPGHRAAARRRRTHQICSRHPACHAVAVRCFDGEQGFCHRRRSDKIRETVFARAGTIRTWRASPAPRRCRTPALLPSIEQGCVGYVYGESTSGQQAVYELGLTGIPIYKSTITARPGRPRYIWRRSRPRWVSTARWRWASKNEAGLAGLAYDDRAQQLDMHVEAVAKSDLRSRWRPGVRHRGARTHGDISAPPVHFAKIGSKNHRHSVNNPYAQFQDAFSMDEILGSRVIYDPLTKLQCWPTSDGSAAAILASEDFVDARGLAALRWRSSVRRWRPTCPGLSTAASKRSSVSTWLCKRRKVYEQWGWGRKTFT